MLFYLLLNPFPLGQNIKKFIVPQRGFPVCFLYKGIEKYVDTLNRIEIDRNKTEIE